MHATAADRPQLHRRGPRISATRVTVALATLNFAILAAIVIVDSDAGPDSPAGKAWVSVCVVIDVVLAACWLAVRIPAHSRRAKAFGLWADLGTASVLLTFASPSDALVSCGILVASGAFFAFYLDHRWLIAHVTFSISLIIGFACYAVVAGEINGYAAFTHADVILVAVVALPISIRVAFLRSERRAQAAQIDPLTGLLNRRGLTQVFESLPATTVQRVHCHVVDIDRFKFINDTYGHVVGDNVIVAIGNLLRDVVGDRGSVARIGGEEFVIVTFADHADPRRIPIPLEIEMPDLPTITWSAGAVAVPATDATASAMWRAVADADAAMYEAKRAGGGHLRLAPNPVDHH